MLLFTIGVASFVIVRVLYHVQYVCSILGAICFFLSGWGNDG